MVSVHYKTHCFVHKVKVLGNHCLSPDSSAIIIRLLKRRYMREYELVVIVNPEIGEDGFLQTIEKIKGLIDQQEGKLISLEQWGRKKFAYPIRRPGKEYSEGDYVLIRFELEPERVLELDKRLRVSEDFLRHLLVRSSEKT